MKVTKEQFIGVTYDELLAENAKLREERDHWHVEQVHAYGNWEDAHKRATELEAENAKLRELVRDLWEACPTDGYYCIYHCEHYDKESESHCKLEDRMEELRIEVDG